MKNKFFYYQLLDEREMCIRDRRGLEQAGIKILPFDEKNLQGDLEIIAGNAFRPDNNVEIAYADKNGLSYKRYHEFLGSFMRDFISMGVAGAHGKTSTTGMLSHVLSHITDTSLSLIHISRPRLLDWMSTLKCWRKLIRNKIL